MGELTAFPKILAVFKGSLREAGKEGKGGKRKGIEKERKGRELRNHLSLSEINSG